MSSRLDTSSSSLRGEDLVQDAVLKVLVLGDPATGKTSIIKRYVQDIFSEHHKTTIGVDFSVKALTVDGITVRLQLWDIAGQEHFRALNRVYYRDAVAAILVHDLSRPETFESVLKWKTEIDTKVQLPNGEPLPVVLCGNKSDIASSETDKAFMDSFCESNGFISWYDTSAKTNQNIDEAARTLVRGVLSKKDVLQQTQPNRRDFIKPGVTRSEESSSWRCCS